MGIWEVINYVTLLFIRNLIGFAMNLLTKNMLYQYYQLYITKRHITSLIVKNILIHQCFKFLYCMLFSRVCWEGP